MAATVEAARLTEAHRLAQARLSAATVRDLLAIFPLLDPADLDATTVRWLRAAVPIIDARRRTSATLAANYVTVFRQLELGDFTLVVPVLADVVNRQQLAASLAVTGPVALKKSVGRGLTIAQAVRSASIGSARAGSRHVLNGGRDTIIGTVDRDRRALGWARVTSGSPCAFCALLSGRGPVYKTRTTAEQVVGRGGGLRGTRGVGHKYHDNCHCSAEPVYDREAEWPPRAREFQALWEQTTTGLSGKDAINAFRQALSPA